MQKFLSILAAALLLSSCGSKMELEPVGIGKDPSELKQSPCACIMIEQERALPEWFKQEYLPQSKS